LSGAQKSNFPSQKSLLPDRMDAYAPALNFPWKAANTELAPM
jgi:hypothetical protein